jgi:hypothetical protein
LKGIKEKKPHNPGRNGNRKRIWLTASFFLPFLFSGAEGSD